MSLFIQPMNISSKNFKFSNIKANLQFKIYWSNFKSILTLLNYLFWDAVCFVRCKDLKWKAFNIEKISNLFVFGGNDSFGDRFYVCRTSLDNTSLAGHFFQGLCYVTHRGIEVVLNEFDILTHSANGYEWYFFNKSHPLIPNAVDIGHNRIIEGTFEKRLIGRCLVKQSNYESLVIGTIVKSDSIWVLEITFNGLKIICKQFQVLLCSKWQ